MVKDNKVVYCESYNETKGYKYVAEIWESANAYGDFYASDNLRQLKSFVYHQVKQLYDTARGNIYYSSDEHCNDPIYMCWREGNKTYKQNLLNWR